MRSFTTRLSCILSQQFAEEAGIGAYLDGSGLWLVVAERGRRYELRDAGHDVDFVGDASHMTLERARRQALEMREQPNLGAGRVLFGKPLRPADLGRFVNAWVSASIAAAAA